MFDNNHIFCNSYKVFNSYLLLWIFYMKLFTRKKYFYYNKLISRFTQLILKLKNNIWSCNLPQKKLLIQHKTILINRSYDITVKIIIIRSIKKLQKSTLYIVHKKTFPLIQDCTRNCKFSRLNRFLVCI